MVWEDHILGGHRRGEAAGKEARRSKSVMTMYEYNESTVCLNEQSKESWGDCWCETKGCKMLGLKRMTASLAVALWPKRGKSNDRQDHMMLYEYSGYSG